MAKKKSRERVYGAQPAGAAPQEQAGIPAQGPVEKLWDGVKSLLGLMKQV